jgi:hypothetical protein
LLIAAINRYENYKMESLRMPLHPVANDAVQGSVEHEHPVDGLGDILMVPPLKKARERGKAIYVKQVENYLSLGDC